MKEKSDRTAYIKKALDSYGYDIYGAIYCHMRSGDTGYLPHVIDNVMQALVNEMRYDKRTYVNRYDSYFEDVSAELSIRGFGAGNVSIRAALYGGQELHAKLKYMNWIINVEYGDVYALRCGRMTHGIWNIVSRAYTNTGLMVIHPADMADLLIRLDSFYPDINKLICPKQNLLHKRMLKQKLDEAQIVAALDEAGIVFQNIIWLICKLLPSFRLLLLLEPVLGQPFADRQVVKLEAGICHTDREDEHTYCHHDMRIDRGFRM